MYMISKMKRLIASVVCVLGWLPVLAQQPAANSGQRLPTHEIRSISPADTSFQDLDFLQQEIGAARVVLLGEPTHGEGNVTEAKIRLVRFLKERMGFTTVAFESGLYELDKAQREIEAGRAAPPEAIGNSVFGIWTSTQEFQAILPLLGKRGLRVAGFDTQLTGAYQDEMLEELEALLKPEKGASSIAYDYLEECFSMMGEMFIFPPANSLTVFNLQLSNARKLLKKVAASPDARRRDRAVFWLQNLRSLQALAHDYATNDPSAKDSATFKAVDSNPRDAQMADNLLWYLRQHPQEKVICWGALPHFANKTEVLHDAEMKAYRPMGRAVKAALGEDAVYILGTLAGGGTYGSFGRDKVVPTPAAGTLEADLLAEQQQVSFVSLKHDAAGQQLTTYAFDYKPLTGAWSEVVDGFLLLQTVQPPHPALPPAPLAEADPGAPSSVRTAAPAYQNPAARTLGKAAATAATLTLRGTVLDDKTGQPVPFATVALPAHATGVVANDAGRFTLPVHRGDVVQISSLGYEAKVLTSAGEQTVVVRLPPSAYALGDVRVSGESLNARKIMRKVIKALPDNYEQHEYVAQVYTHDRLSSYDTLRHEVEYISQLYEPEGYRYQDGDFLMMGPTAKRRFQEKHEIVPWPNSTSEREAPWHGIAKTYNPVRTSPLFKKATLGRFALRLDSVVQQEGEALYVIAFAAKRATHRTTGTYLEKGYSGKVYVRQQDYAVVRYEALWQFDTVRYNSVAHKYYGQHNQISRLYRDAFSDKRSVNTVTYEKGTNGRYHPAVSLSQSVAVGRRLGAKPFFYQSINEAYFTSQPPGTLLLPAPPPPPGMDLRLIELWNTQLQQVSYRPEFWETYQRPVHAKPAATPPATTP